MTDRYCVTTDTGQVTSKCFAFRDAAEAVGHLDSIEPFSLTRIDARKYDCSADNVCTLKAAFETDAGPTPSVSFAPSASNKALFGLVGDAFDGRPATCMARCGDAPFMTLDDACVCLDGAKSTIQAVAAMSKDGYCAPGGAGCINVFGGDKGVVVDGVDTRRAAALDRPAVAAPPPTSRLPSVGQEEAVGPGVVADPPPAAAAPKPPAVQGAGILRDAVGRLQRATAASVPDGDALGDFAWSSALRSPPEASAPAAAPLGGDPAEMAPVDVANVIGVAASDALANRVRAPSAAAPPPPPPQDPVRAPAPTPTSPRARGWSLLTRVVQRLSPKKKS